MNVQRSIIILITLWLGTSGLVPCLADEAFYWGWRRDHTGYFPEERTPPLSWGPTRNVRWMHNFGANGQAGPMVVGNRVFALCEPAQLYCFDKASGEVLWHIDTGDTDIWTTPHLWKTLKIQLRKRRTRFASLGRSVARMEKARDKLAGERKAVRDLKPELRLLEARIEVTRRQLTELGDEISGISNYYLNPTSTICGYAYPTPCTDGKTLFVYFGGGTLRAYDINGEKIWTRFLSRPPETTGITASPTLSDGKLIVTHHDTLALDKKTGETLWVAKTGSGYNTPVATRTQALE